MNLGFRKSQESFGNKFFKEGMLEAVGFWLQLLMPIEKNVFGLTVGMTIFGNDRVKLVNVGATVTESTTVGRKVF